MGVFFVLVGGTHIPHNEIEMTRLWQPTGSSLLTEQWSWEESTKVWSPFTICGQYIAYFEEISGLGAQGQKVIHKGGIFFFLMSWVRDSGSALHILLLPSLHMCVTVMRIEPLVDGTALDWTLLVSGQSTFKMWPIFLVKIYLCQPNILR